MILKNLRFFYFNYTNIYRSFKHMLVFNIIKMSIYVNKKKNYFFHLLLLFMQQNHLF